MSLALGLMNLIARRRMRHLTEGWGMRWVLWVHGLDSPLAYMRLTQKYSLESRAEQTSCPTLICSAENDEIGITASTLYHALTCKKAFIAFTAREGAGNHCEASARSVLNQRAFDWLDQVFE